MNTKIAINSTRKFVGLKYASLHQYVSSEKAANNFKKLSQAEVCKLACYTK